MDISPLADGNFLLLHGPLLDEGTNGSGPIAAHTTDEVRHLRLTRQDVVTDEPVGVLSQALELVDRHPHAVELQLDLKPHSALSGLVLSRFVSALQPVKERVRVTSVADWLLRRLHHLDPELPLGFDPMLYLDLEQSVGSSEVGEREPTLPPFRFGGYGYWDDHPLATRRWGDTASYLAARAEALWVQVPFGVIWYIRAAMIAQALEDGFDWIAYLHGRGAEVDVWTLNPGRPEDVALARRLVAAGVDRITTDDAPAWTGILDADVAF